VKADVVVDGVECEKAEFFECGSVLVYHDDLAVLEVLLVVNHDGIKIKCVSGGRVRGVKKKKVVVNYLANEIEGGVRAKGLGAGDKLKASDVNAGNDKGF
jgi:hypothetical protein